MVRLTETISSPSVGPDVRFGQALDHPQVLDGLRADRRTHQGRLLAARKRGRVGGNPGLRARDPAAIRKVQNSRDKTWLDRVLAQLDIWLPTVQRMRPAQPWGDVVRG